MTAGPRIPVSALRQLADDCDWAMLDLAVNGANRPPFLLADADRVVKAAAFATVGTALRRIADAVEAGR